MVSHMVMLGPVGKARHFSRGPRAVFKTLCYSIYTWLGSLMDHEKLSNVFGMINQQGL